MKDKLVFERKISVKSKYVLQNQSPENGLKIDIFVRIFNYVYKRTLQAQS